MVFKRTTPSCAILAAILIPIGPEDTTPWTRALLQALDQVCQGVEQYHDIARDERFPESLEKDPEPVRDPEGLEVVTARHGLDDRIALNTDSTDSCPPRLRYHS